MESRPHFQQTSYPAINLRPSLRWLRDSAQQLQQRRLPRTVSPDQPEYFPSFHFQVHVLQRPERLFLLSLQELPRLPHDVPPPIPQRAFPFAPTQPVQFAQSLPSDCEFAHRSSRFTPCFIVPTFQRRIQSEGRDRSEEHTS